MRPKGNEMKKTGCKKIRVRVSAADAQWFRRAASIAREYGFTRDELFNAIMLLGCVRLAMTRPA